MRTRIATVAQTFQRGDHLTDGEMVLLATRLDEALAMMKAVGASHVTSRGIFEAWMSADTSLRNRKVPYKTLDFESQARIKTELESLLSIIRIGGVLPDVSTSIAERLRQAGEAIEAVAQDNILAKSVLDPLEMIKDHLPPAADEATTAPALTM